MGFNGLQNIVSHNISITLTLRCTCKICSVYAVGNCSRYYDIYHQSHNENWMLNFRFTNRKMAVRWRMNLVVCKACECMLYLTQDKSWTITTFNAFLCFQVQMRRWKNYVQFKLSLHIGWHSWLCMTVGNLICTSKQFK